MKFLRVFGFCLVIISFLFSGCSSEKKSDSEYYLFIGTYTGKSSEGIYVYKFDAADGSLTPVSTAKGVDNPSYLAISPNQRYVYAVNELGGGQNGNVSSFSFSKRDGKLTFLNKQSTRGSSPCYVSIDETGQYAFAANYGGGSFSMFPIKNDGSLDSASVTVQHHGSSVVEKRQETPHVHCTYITPDNRYLLVNDLGIDHVSQYMLDTASGTLNKQPVNEYEAEPGAGPRHITFHPNGKYAYLITEISGSVVAFSYDDGKLSPIQTISALPEGYDGKFSGADIHVSPDGKFLYTSLREDLNDIVIYSINQETGKLTLAGRQSTMGLHPRNFTIDPSGKYLLAANMNSDNIVVFKRDKSTGKLAPTGTEVEISMPVCLKMMSME